MSSSVIQLKCSCNNYPWGKKGHDSLAARLCEQTPSDFKVDDGTEYAEMWMGTYPETPSCILSTGETLQDVIDANAEKLVGRTVLDRFGKDLPFLPKILSIAKALPLQIHPSKSLATQLHHENPEKFSDPNHKPEIAIALSTFELFVNFKPLSDIASLLQLVPLTRFRPSPEAVSPSSSTETLKQLCKAMLEAPPEIVRDVQTGLSSLPRSAFGKHSYIADLLPRLQAQYTPSDNGSLVALICMNFLTLQPGEAVYVPADGLHAYLSGDIVECMARSNNMLNTGFCPRADRDNIALFTDTLTFNPQQAEQALLSSRFSERGRAGRTKVYSPPIDEFDVLVTELRGGVGEKEVVAPIAGPSVMVATAGKGRMRAEAQTVPIKEGFIYFVGKGVELEFDTETIGTGEEGEGGGEEHQQPGLTIYRAFVE